METDDPDTPTAVPEHLLFRSLFLRHSCLDKEFMVNVKLQLYTKEVSDLSSSCLKRMSCLCPVNCKVFESKFRNMSAITEFLKEFQHTLSLRVSEHLETTSKDDSHLHRVSDDQGVELTFDVSSNDLEISSKTELLTQAHRLNDSRGCRS